MVKLYEGGAYLVHGTHLVSEKEAEKVAALTGKKADKEEARKGTMAYSILEAHNTSGNMENLKVKFDAMTSHDITFVGIIQTAKASGMEKFPLPYVLTNCHNSLCAVGGTINEDDHVFGLSACKKYGGIFVPPHIAVIHQYMREMMAGCGKMILGSDELTDADIRIFFKNKQEQSEKVASLQDYTLHRLGSCYKTQLYEAGLLESNRANSTRKILKPILDIAFEHWLYDHDLGIMVKTLTGVR